MRITLLQIPWSDLSARDFKNVSRKYALYPPIGLLYLASFLERHGHEADVLDLEMLPQTQEELLGNIASAKPDLIGITATTPIVDRVQEYAGFLKERLRLPIVVGGPHITALRERALAADFDFGVAGEGEQTLLELMDAMTAAKEFTRIAGLIYRDGSRIIANPPRPLLDELDRLPFPARHKLDMRQYAFEVPGRGVIPVATMELTRGCPFQCVFCSEWLSTGKKLRKRSVANVLEEIRQVRNDFGIDHFFMLDSTLTVDRKLIEDFCRILIDQKCGITFEGQTRPDLIDEPLLLLMQEAGLNRLNFGLESSNLRVLTLIKKQVRPEAAREAFRLCKKLGISTLCGTMMGNPGDTRETILETARFVRSIPEIRYSPMAIAMPYPGTELLSMAQKGMHGLRLLETDFKKYSRYAGGVMEVNGMKPEELIKLQRRALFIMHSTPSKMFGLIRHFGLRNCIQIGLRMIWSEIVTRLGGREPVLQNIARENTTLQNLRKG